MERKTTKQYIFTVEGETEKWYLEWLRDRINECDNSKYKASIIAKVQKNPLKYAKGQISLTAPRVTHLCDYESEEECHTGEFSAVLDNLKEANGLAGKSIKYSLGYSNFSFELWIVLHKIPSSGILTHRRLYLAPINKIFDEKFGKLDEYKKEANFKRCLSKLTLNDVINAIARARKIMEDNKQNGLVECEYKGFRYYRENPSLTIWESICGILTDCGLI